MAWEMLQQSHGKVLVTVLTMPTPGDNGTATAMQKQYKST